MYQYISNDSSFYDLALELSETRPEACFCDIESTGLDPRQDKLILFQVMLNGKIFIFDFNILGLDHLKYLVELLQKTGITMVFHNAKFDIKFLAHNTGIWLGNLYDTMNAEVLINAGVGKSTYSLKELANKYLGIELQKEERENFFESTSITEGMLQYAAMDVKVLEEIYAIQIQKIKDAKEEKILKIEMDLLPVVAKMEYDGVLLDKEQWLVLETKEKERLERVSSEIIDKFLENINLDSYADAYELAKAISFPTANLSKKKELLLKQLTTRETLESWFRQNFNINSTYQLQACLKLSGIETGSTDKKLLKKLEQSPIINSLLEKSECSKRISTYGSGVLEFINPVSGRIHTEFLNMGTATGRFSSGNPINLQNIPTAEGYRESFIASPDHDWLSLDYSQQEFRLTGAVSNEPVIIDAYKQGMDMHTATASLIYNKPLSEIDKKERFVGKTANFTIIYGGTEYALGKNLGLSKEKSLEILAAFKNGYPRLAAFKEAAESMIVKLGFSTTVLGRRRYNIPKPLYMNSNEYMQYISRVKREGFNHIIQGTAADVTKLAMINIYRNNPFGDRLKLMIQVHDELNAEAHKSISKDAAEFMKEEMLKAEQRFLGDMPAAVDVHISDHWVH